MKKFYSFFIIFTLLLFLVLDDCKVAMAQIATTTATTCGSDIITTMVQPVFGSQVSGSAVQLLAKSIPATGLSNVEFHTLQRGLIGSGGVGADVTTWSRNWDTYSYPNDDYDLFARALYYNSANQFYTCDSQPIKVKIINGTTTATNTQSLIVDVNTKYWEGPTNIWVNFVARAFLHNADGTNTEVTATSAFEWATNIGSIEPAHDKAVFKSGAREGVGAVEVKSIYNNMVVKGKIDIKVYNSSDYTSYPSSRDTTATTSATSASSSDQKTSEAVDSNEPADLDPVLSECLKQAVGEDRYNDFVNKVAKPTSDELKKAWSCFAQSKYIVPANWSPIQPEAVKNLPKDNKKAKIEKIINQKATANDGSKKDVIVLSGKTLPNSNIFLYVFSEPLVLAVVSDENGNWNYQLENPLDPGQHEAYIALDIGGENFVASDPLIFEIARAQSDSTNPNGASLVLTTNHAYWQNNYIIYAIISVGLALLFVLFFIKRKMTRKVTLNNVT